MTDPTLAPAWTHATDDLAEALLPTLEPGDPPAVVVIVDVERRIVMVDDLDDHPALALRGARLTRDVEAVGLLSGASAFRLDADRATEPRRRSRLLVVQHRNGESRTVLAVDGEATHRWTTPAEPADHHGLVADALRRVLDLPTAAATDPAHTWWRHLWADRLVAQAAASSAPERLGWHDLVGCHPLCDLGLVSRHCHPGQLADAALEFDRTWDWDRLRRHTAAQAIDRSAVSAPHARWFDSGSFARASVAALPPLDEAIAAIADLLHPEAARLVVTALAHPGER